MYGIESSTEKSDIHAISSPPSVLIRARSCKLNHSPVSDRPFKDQPVDTWNGNIPVFRNELL